MPIYEYECTSCGERSEVLQRMSDPPPDGCSACGGPLKRLLSAPSFQFKGTGWYVTDYADKRKKSDGKASSGSKGSSESPSGVKTGDDSSSGDKSSADKGGSSDKVSKTGDKPSSSSSAG